MLVHKALTPQAKRARNGQEKRGQPEPLSREIAAKGLAAVDQITKDGKTSIDCNILIAWSGQFHLLAKEAHIGA
jgi:hypothetical protein